MIITPTNPPVAQASAPRVKVTVKINPTTREVSIKSSHPPGDARLVAEHLLSNRLRIRATGYASNGYSLRECIARITIITPEQWGHAIASEIISRLTTSPEATVEMSAICQGGYLALDDAVYRLTPVEMAPQSKAMRAITRRQIEKAQRESERLLAETNTQVASVLATAQAKMAEAQVILADAKAAGKTCPPPWTTTTRDGSIPVMYKTFDTIPRWCVGITLHTIIAKFIFTYETDPRNQPGHLTTKHWTALPHTPVPTLVWVPLLNEKGQYKQIEAFVHPSHHRLPHISWERACMESATAPRTLTSPASLILLVQSLQSLMSIVELHSLLCNATKWHPNYQEALPPSIKPAVLAQELNRLQFVAADATTTQTPDEANADASATFNVR